MDNKIMKKSLVRFSCCTQMAEKVAYSEKVKTCSDILLCELCEFGTFISRGLRCTIIDCSCCACKVHIVEVSIFFTLFNTICIMFIYCRRIFH